MCCRKHTPLQARGLWWSFPVTNILVTMISLGWFARGSWKTTRLTEEDREGAKVTEEAIIEEGLR